MLDIIKDMNQKGTQFNNEQELVQKDKKEYKIIGTFLRRPGLQLFAYDKKKDALYRVDIEKKKLVSFIDAYGNLRKNKDVNDKNNVAFLKANIKSHHVHFEALNWKSAKKRVERYKKGMINELSNLRMPGSGISPFGNKID